MRAIECATYAHMKVDDFLQEHPEVHINIANEQKETAGRALLGAQSHARAHIHT